jgi:DNA invertase Pin-like site-specific DNA recombinase
VSDPRQVEVLEELRVHGVQVVSVSDGFALDDIAAEVVLAVIASPPKMERLTINGWIAAARNRIKAEGRSWGRPPRLQRVAPGGEDG